MLSLLSLVFTIYVPVCQFKHFVEEKLSKQV